MGSLADRLRKDLEAHGEYVVMANASTSWFAVFPPTWHHRTEGAMGDGREGPNLVVYKTRSDDERDHYVIPYSVIRDLLVEDTLTTSAVNGVQRWNFTLKNGELHVSHRAGTVDVSQYHGARLLVEEVGSRMSEEVAADGTRLDNVRIPVVSAGPSHEAREEPSASGAGFGQSAENRKVEEAAVHLVSEQYRQEGWQVVSVEAKRCGFDLLCVRDREEVHVEVKGVAGTDRRFVITAGELRCALEDDQFVLALVTAALSSQPVLERLPAQVFRCTFVFVPIQYWASPATADTRERQAKGSGTVVP